MTTDQLLEKLRNLPGVTVEQQPSDVEDLAYFVLRFTQPVDHCEIHPDTPCDTSLGTFEQQVALLHRNEVAPVPMVVHTTGYALNDYFRKNPVELTRYLDANQVSIEHRYFGESRPVPTDWTKLTVEQMAADEHAIITALKTIYRGVFLTTGGSKGGMTAIIHRRFYPEDAEGTVAYVAPLTFGTADPRYPPFFDRVGPDACRRAVRLLAIEALQNRRAAFESAARQQANYSYTRIAVEPAVEAAIAGFEWAFWQYFGEDNCRLVPEVTASDADVFTFVNRVSPVGECSDQRLYNLEAYYYQTYAQLGYPEYNPPYLAGLMQFSEEDYAGELPTPEEPDFDPLPMHDILDWVGGWGERLMLVYGDWDPWFEGRLVLGSADDSETFVQSHGSHTAQIGKLDPDQRDTALTMLKNWTGVTPKAWLRRGTRTAAVASDDGQAERVPPARVHAPVAGR